MKIKSSYIALLLLSAVLARADDIVTMPAYETRASSATGELTFDSFPDSAFEDNGGFLDTPRNLSTLSPAEMARFNISAIGEISDYVSDSQTLGAYGQSSNINVRGDLSEQYVNNERRTNNAFGFSQSFNAVESVDVIHGAPSVVFGPGFYSGGYTDFQTKQAVFAPFTTVGLTLGTWAPGGSSYLDTSLTIDQDAPISENTAIRLSYEVKRDQTFYYRNGGRDDSQDVYLTLTHIFNVKATLVLNAEFSWQAAPEEIGINRVTQDLIWHDRYITGTTSNPLDMALVPNGPVVTLKPTDTVMSVGDFSNATVLFTQAIFTDRVSDSITLKNYTMVEAIDRRRFNAYEYAEYSNQYTFDNRTELHIDVPHRLYTILGLQERYEYRRTETDYNNTFFEAHDVTNGVIHASADYPAFYEPGIVGEGGRDFFDITYGDTDTTESRVYSASPFLQQRLYLGDRVQLLYGVRADAYRVFVQDPLNPTIRDDTTTVSEGGTASIIYIPAVDWSVYATAAHLAAVNGSVTGGGIVMDPNAKISDSDFRSANRLYEVGARWERGNASIALTGFWQYREQHDFYTDAPDNVVARGVELEVKWKPSRDWFVIASATYIEENLVNSLPFEYSGIGLPAATVPGDYRMPGLSRLSVNATVGYNLTKHVTVSTTITAQSEQSGDVLGGYHIPGEYDVGAQVSYGRDNWRLTLAGRNLTNQLIFIHNGDEYGDNVLVSRALPINASLFFTAKL